jgi:hypothetical protein
MVAEAVEAEAVMEVEAVAEVDMVGKDMAVAIMMVEEADTAEESDGNGVAGTG